MKPAAPWWAYACLAASMSLVGSYVALSKLLVVLFPVFLLAWLRFGIAALAMAGWLRCPPGEAPLGPRERRLLFLEALFGHFLFSVCMLLGVARTTALAAGVILAAIPAVVAVMSGLFLGERIAPRVAAGIACAVGGIALVSLSRHGGAAASSSAAAHGAAWLGNALLFGAVCCEAAYVVIGKLLTGRLGARRISARVNLWGLALVTPLGLAQAADFDFGAIDAPTWGLLLFYALAASVFTVWLWMTGLRHVAASSAGVFTVFLPLGAAAVGVLALGENLRAAEAAAYALALAGVVLAARGAPPPA